MSIDLKKFIKLHEFANAAYAKPNFDKLDLPDDLVAEMKAFHAAKDRYDDMLKKYGVIK
jgi:hypothetical protein